MKDKLIFVYGTLRTGGFFAFHMPRQARMKLIELHGVQMYDLGSFPGLVRTDNKDDYVIGELHDCSILSDEEWYDLLYRLDIVENVSGNLYQRDAINTPYGEAIIYVVNRKAWFDESHERKPFTLHHDWAKVDQDVAKGVHDAEIRSEKFEVEKEEAVETKG